MPSPLRLFRHLTPGLLALAALAAVSSAEASAAPIEGEPPSGALSFTVLRDGDEIGTHVLNFGHDGDALTVDVATDIKVTLPLVDIAVYRFTHRAHEVWRDGRLSQLTSETDDDGEQHALSVVAEQGGALSVRSDLGAHASAADIVPASLWNHAVPAQETLLNTLTGVEMAVTVEDLGRETITVGGAERQAEHYKLTGDLARELWYDGDGVLRRVRFQAEDESTIEYVLQ